MLAHWPFLSLLIWTPVIGSVLVFVTGGARHPNRARIIALLCSLISIGWCVLAYLAFDSQRYAMQLVETLPWVPAYKMNYSLGVDGIALALIFLTVFTIFLVVLASW